MFTVASSRATYGLVYSSVTDLGLKTPTSAAFNRIFEVYSATGRCKVGKQLSSKYNVPEDDFQYLISLRNKFTNEQTWYNPQRTKKPQNFKTESPVLDPTENGRFCDFCRVEELTAEDEFGRIRKGSVTSASNLFKYCAPGHGLLLLKNHDPLDFGTAEVKDLMECAQEWFEKTAELHPDAVYPLFIWNCLSRAGASQFHGHAQVMLSPVPFPCYETRRAAIQRYEAEYGTRYVDDLFEAYDDVQLLVPVSRGTSKCMVFPSLTPYKDMEVVLNSTSITNAAFCESLALTLRTLMEEFKMQTFNVGIQGIPVKKESGTQEFDVVARVVSRGHMTNQGSDFGGMEVFGGASIGHTDPFLIAEVLKKKFTSS